MKRISAVLYILFFHFLGSSANAVTPEFLPSYYEDALKFNGKKLELKSQEQTPQAKTALFQSSSGKVAILVEYIPCTRDNCAIVYSNLVQAQNEELISKGGKFLSYSALEFETFWKAENVILTRVYTRIPNAIIVWSRQITWLQAINNKFSVPAAPFLDKLHSAVKKHRYEASLKLTNIDWSLWSTSAHDYAKELLSNGKKTEALNVLKHVIKWAPNNLEAHMDYAENLEGNAARASAMIVWNNAEDPLLIKRSAVISGFSIDEIPSLPTLEKRTDGLKLILVPLPPCDIRLLKETGDLFSKSFQIPVQFANLPEEWRWDSADRLYQQRDLQNTIMKKKNQIIDFSGWNKTRYREELLNNFSGENPLKTYSIELFLKELDKQPGQFDSRKYIAKLIEIRRKLDITDPRTMLVAVTAQDIYGGGEENYLFSGAMPVQGVWASILSYARMKASTLNEPYESRNRLINRVTKELVPAAFKQLEIPRPADPTDPYSFSDGVARLEQKTLKLSEPTQKALDDIRKK